MNPQFPQFVLVAAMALVAAAQPSASAATVALPLVQSSTGRWDIDGDGADDFTTTHSRRSDFGNVRGYTFLIKPLGSTTFLKEGHYYLTGILNALTEPASLGQVPPFGFWSSPTENVYVTYESYLNQPQYNRYFNTFYGLTDAWVGFRMIRGSDVYYGALHLDLYLIHGDPPTDDPDVIPIGPSFPEVRFLEGVIESTPNTPLQFTPVPEPSTMIFSASGLLIYASRRNRKKPNKTVVATAGNVPRSLRSGSPFSAVPHLDVGRNNSRS